jgi:hypothetical protein
MDTPKALSRGLTLAILLAGIGVAFGGCAANTRPLARPASLDAKPAVKAKTAVVALPSAPVDTAIDAPPKEKWVDKLHQDIHESKLRLEKWNEEIKSYQPGQGDQQAGAFLD